MITRYRLKQVLRYHPSTGALYWLVKRERGKIAGHIGLDGYLRIRINRMSYLSHRLIWFYMYGYWSDKAIDHIDWNKSNNKLSNLREATRNENQYNSLVRNKLGVKGVEKNFHRYRAKATYNKRFYHLGCYDTLLEAKNAYDNFAKSHHGQFYAGSK